MYRTLPNQLTVLRLILAAVFFVVLNQYRYASHGSSAALLTAIVVFLLAAVTDWLDGYLARRWKVESTFGRIMDPFCDKVLIIGAFVYMAGPRFVDPGAVASGSFFTMISGIYSWMVAVILARELLVTSVRGESEVTGVAFTTTMFGKVKMFLQSLSIPVILGIVWLDPAEQGRQWLSLVRDILIYATVTATVLSGLPYVSRAARVMKG